ncbi:MAG TPA: bifunctional glutamate N-acetyltransferase/amino-acid acetyltransferase ArgJ [Polyangia bacterium]|nr:bifunctional glutamate N-acetyltransferase/amino-acid acetyltransferase ArgJ [Polyangia bacterium]HVZ86241.1 bifunctional glutamate N-acetyltransferase/amino-acid acetyltransferase ArgJ [Polyangia bacterium]
MSGTVSDSTSTGSKSFAPPLGFRFGATAAGVKEAGGARKDVALIASEVPCAAAGVFTVNKLCAAPVRYGASRLPAADVRAIVANSGNANALTGPVGAADERAVAAAVARALGASPEQVLTASTGGIGIRLPVERITAAVPALVAALGDDVAGAAEAIRTTDLRTKMAFRHLELGGKTVRFAAIAKGSGMIHPQMATMLCFIATDARVAPEVLQRALAAAADDTFNTITVDGDMSTNDTVIALANGASGAPAIAAGTPAFTALQSTLTELCAELARAIAADGEGATKLLIVDVAGAPDAAMARDLARAVAGGSLVKSGIFGGDPSWGRILAALGARIGARGFAVDPAGVALDIQGVRVYQNGGPVAFDKDALSRKMHQAEIAVRLDLGLGAGAGRALGCDLTFDYVKINAEYYSGPGATTAPTDGARRPAGSVNRPVIVEALSYIRRFAGKRAVIKYGGAAMIDPALKRSFAEEMVLLQSAGLRPVIVHGGGPEITKTLEKMGRKSEFADGQRITGAEEVRVVEMVLTGRINTEIVGLINSLGGNAIGLSGKDGRLLVAHKLAPAPGKPDLGFVGEIESVNSDLLDMFLDRGYMPVISPVGFGMDGASYNINADVAAGEIASACGAERLIFLTDVAGILDDQGNLISEIKAAELEAKLGKSIRGGMHVKAQAVLHALASGVRAVHIVDGRTPHSVVAELFTDHGVGTWVT